MKSDVQIQTDVMDQLKWEPFLKASEIGVAVKDGVVTLSGHVDSYSKKLAAENAAKKIKGVKAIAEDIQIGVSPAYRKSDTDIAAAVLNALKWHAAVQDEKVKIKVEDGYVKLEGEVEWEYQRNYAKSAIEHLEGVRSVLNFITVKPKVSPSEIQRKISAAFQRSASLDAEKITATVEGSKVILRGFVRSYAEKEDAAHAAWAAPGITDVENKLVIKLLEYAY
jgi:osmotically-inducible protein OsmY